jgi:hypothetical protein
MLNQLLVGTVPVSCGLVGDVYQLISAPTGQVLAGELLPAISDDLVQLISRDLRAANTLHHRNLHRYHGCHYDEAGALYVLAEAAPKDTLQDLMQQFTVLPEKLVSQHHYTLLVDKGVAAPV